MRQHEMSPHIRMCRAKSRRRRGSPPRRRCFPARRIVPSSTACGSTRKSEDARGQSTACGSTRKSEDARGQMTPPVCVPFCIQKLLTHIGFLVKAATPLSPIGFLGESIFTFCMHAKTRSTRTGRTHARRTDRMHPPDCYYPWSAGSKTHQNMRRPSPVGRRTRHVACLFGGRALLRRTTEMTPA